MEFLTVAMKCQRTHRSSAIGTTNERTLCACIGYIGYIRTSLPDTNAAYGFFKNRMKIKNIFDC